MSTASHADVEEVKATSSVLLAAAGHIAEYCDKPNRAFMQCRYDKQNPEACLEEGRHVTACTAEFFKILRSNCNEQFTDLWECLDKNNQDFERCARKRSLLNACTREKMGFINL